MPVSLHHTQCRPSCGRAKPVFVLLALCSMWQREDTDTSSVHSSASFLCCSIPPLNSSVFRSPCILIEAESSCFVVLPPTIQVIFSVISSFQMSCSNTSLCVYSLYSSSQCFSTYWLFCMAWITLKKLCCVWADFKSKRLFL